MNFVRYHQIYRKVDMPCVRDCHRFARIFKKLFKGKTKRIQKQQRIKLWIFTLQFRISAPFPFPLTFDTWWQQKFIHFQTRQLLKTVDLFKYVWTFVNNREKNLFFETFFPPINTFIYFKVQVHLNQNRDPPPFILTSPPPLILFC